MNGLLNGLQTFEWFRYIQLPTIARCGARCLVNVLLVSALESFRRDLDASHCTYTLASEETM